ncbi:MAG TPA: TrmH family RNA methyltransferase, partial [Casimicrobiaceae bacterium]
MPRVTSRHNPRLKEAATLVASSRDRRKAGRCVLEGEHLVGVYLERIGAPETLIVVEGRHAEPSIHALAARIPPQDVLVVPESVFCEVSTLPAAIGLMAVVATPHRTPPAPGRFHLLLDDLQDPGNVGTMLRTAAAAGVDQVLLSKHCAF